MDVIDRLITFTGVQDIPDHGSPDSGEFVQDTVASGGSPTVKVADGFMALDLDTTLESQLAAMYQNDVLSYDIDDLRQVDFYAKLSTDSLHAAISGAFGLISAYNTDPDAIAAAALFRFDGSNAVQCETDDGTNDNDDKATGLNIDTTVRRFTIDFASGVRSIVPGPSVGGKANVLFSMDDARQNLQQVARSTTFDMSNYTAKLQLYAMIQKGAASSVVAADVEATLSIERIRLRYKSQA